MVVKYTSVLLGRRSGTHPNICAVRPHRSYVGGERERYREKR